MPQTDPVDRVPPLEFEMMYFVRTTNPLEPTVGAPRGARQYWQVSEARLEGGRIKAELAGTGTDWMLVGDDGFWRPNVRLQFLTDDGAVILLHYTGLVEQTETFKKAAQSDQATRWEDQYMRLSLCFQTGDSRYQWLNRNLFVAKGRLEATGRIAYAVYRLG